MTIARILWTLIAMASCAVCVYAAHTWAADLKADTPYQLWPLAGVMYIYAYAFAAGVIVMAGFVIYTIWMDRE